MARTKASVEQREELAAQRRALKLRLHAKKLRDIEEKKQKKIFDEALEESRQHTAALQMQRETYLQHSELSHTEAYNESKRYTLAHRAAGYFKLKPHPPAAGKSTAERKARRRELSATGLTPAEAASRAKTTRPQGTLLTNGQRRHAKNLRRLQKKMAAAVPAASAPPAAAVPAASAPPAAATVRPVRTGPRPPKTAAVAAASAPPAAATVNPSAVFPYF